SQLPQPPLVERPCPQRLEGGAPSVRATQLDPRDVLTPGAERRPDVIKGEPGEPRVPQIPGPPAGIRRRDAAALVLVPELDAAHRSVAAEPRECLAGRRDLRARGPDNR